MDFLVFNPILFNRSRSMSRLYQSKSYLDPQFSYTVNHIISFEMYFEPIIVTSKSINSNKYNIGTFNGMSRELNKINQNYNYFISDDKSTN